MLILTEFMHRGKEIREELTRTFDQIAEDFDRTRYKPWPESVNFEKSLPRSSRVLDLGCGNGRNALFLASKGHEVVGIDTSMNLLRIAREKARKKGLSHKVQFIQSDVCFLPLRESSIDACYYIATLHHLPSEEERLQSLRELRRCLKTKGRGIISVWAFDQPKFASLLEEHKRRGFNFGDVYLPWKRSNGKIFNRFYHLFYGEELRNLVLKSGLSTERFYMSSDNYFAVVVKIG